MKESSLVGSCSSLDVSQENGKCNLNGHKSIDWSEQSKCKCITFSMNNHLSDNPQTNDTKKE